MLRKTPRIGLTRLLIGLVLTINLQCSISFLFNATRYAPVYELVGIPGEVAIQGFGILFLMWNVPYVVALYHPLNYRTSLFEAVLMQFVGLIGETFIYIGLPSGYPSLRDAISLFIIFDGLGLILLVIAFLLTMKTGKGK